jgi:hypothetical protein
MSWLKRSAFLMLTLPILVVFFSFSVHAEEVNLMYGTGYALIDNLRLYSSADFYSDVIDMASCGDRVVIIRESGTKGWYRVNYNLQEGYMRGYCLEVKTEDQIELGLGAINDDIVYLRSGPGTEYSIYKSGFQGKTFPIIGFDDGWYKILYNNNTCYVRSDLMDLTEIPYENKDSENEPQFFVRGETIGEITYTETEQVAMAAPGSTYVPISGNYILAQAQHYIGTPYLFGGYSPDGFDCSGLIYYILNKVGYPCERSAAYQYNMGYSVSRNELRPGDLVFFANTYASGISHVGVYAGGGKFIHAPSDGGSVCYSSLSGYWSDHYHGARRIG